MPKKRKSEAPKDIDTGSPIKRGSVPYIVLKEIGELGDNGRKVFSLGYGGRIEGKPEFPLSSLACPIINTLLDVIHWPSDEAAVKDLELFKSYLSQLHVTPPKAKKGRS